MTTAQLDKTEKTQRVLKFAIWSLDLISGLKAVQQTAQNATRTEWLAINFNLNSDWIRLSTVDGFRIATYKIFSPDLVEGQFRISLESAKSLISQFKKDNCWISVSAEISETVHSPLRQDYSVHFSWGSAGKVHSVLTNLIEYPNLENAIPVLFKTSVLLDRKTFLSGVKHLYASSGGDFTKMIFLSFIKDETGGEDHKVELSLTGGIVSATFRAVAIAGEDFKITLQSQFLLDPLKNLSSDRILLQANSATSPVLLTTPDEKYLAAVMPLAPTRTA